ncbi:MAG: excisionase family DNA-binding protein [Deltaproteobacteria bacterium]|nr:excisionase family DNA-binding protein [Deltaproteobacteria bacterium]
MPKISDQLFEKPISAREIAERLSITTATVRNWAHKGIIPFIRVGARTMRFKWCDVEKIIQKNGDIAWLRYKSKILSKPLLSQIHRQMLLPRSARLRLPSLRLKRQLRKQRVMQSQKRLTPKQMQRSWKLSALLRAKRSRRSAKPKQMLLS